MRTIYRFLLTIVPSILLCFFIISGCEKKPQKAESDWIEYTYSQMSSDQKIGQLFCLRVDPIQYFLYTNYKRNIDLLIGKYKPGAVFLIANLDTVKQEVKNEFDGNKLHDELIEIQKHSEIPLLVAANFESGAWYWDKYATRFPFPLALGAARSPEMGFRQGKITAVEAKAQGINWILSPIVNTSIDPANIPLQIYSLGNDKELVAELGSQFIRGVQEVGIAACMKYFPSEKNQSLLHMSPDDIDQSQLNVFKTVIDAGVSTIMGSPVDVSTIQSDLQPLHEKQLINELLRKQLGFQGLFTCEVDYRSDSANVSKDTEVFLEMVRNGTNMFILPEIFGTTIPHIDFLLDRVYAGMEDMSPIDDSVRKILYSKNQLNLQLVKSERSLRAMAGIGLPEYHQTSQEISNQSVTILKNENNLIPIDYHKQYITSIAFFDDFSPQYATIYSDSLKQISEDIKRLNIFGIPDKRIQYEIIRRASESDVVLCSIFLKFNKDASDFGLAPEIQKLIDPILNVNKHVILISFHNPYLLNYVPDVQSYVIAYSPSQNSINSVLEVIFGKWGASGKLPISISEKFPIGFGLSTGGENISN